MYAQKNNLSWKLHGCKWPNHAHSRMVDVGAQRWHVQQFGQGPDLVLLHGTGASVHSWGKLAGLLASDFSLTVVDLPGHGFTSAPRAQFMSLPGFSQLVAKLLSHLQVEPRAIIGHSAGVAIAARISLDKLSKPDMIIGINPALLPFPGPARMIFPAIARLLFMNPVTPRLLSWRAQKTAVVNRLLEGTGSQIDAQSLELYALLFQSPQHVQATLAMMANWHLERLTSDLLGLEIPLDMIIGGSDMTIPPEAADRVAEIVALTRIELIPRRGHLVHEEDPVTVAQCIRKLIDNRAIDETELPAGKAAN